jgi:hypothetical protein
LRADIVARLERESSEKNARGGVKL